MIAPDQNQIEIPSKSQIRQQVRFSISSISSVNRSAQEIKLSARLNHWLELIGVTRGDLIFAFWPTLSEEPDFRQWLSSLQSKGIQYALPRLEWPTRTLKFLKIGNPDTDLEIAPNGLAQPRKPLELIPPDQTTAVLVPGLAFDLSGGRLGRGAGFYDRTLIQIRTEIPRWGIGFNEQVIPEIPMDPWDQTLGGLILPTGLIKTCNKKDQ